MGRGAQVRLEDPFRDIANLPEDVLKQLAVESEARAEEARRSHIRKEVFTAALQGLNSGSTEKGLQIVDIGCGTGSFTRAIAAMPGVRHVIGIDPCLYFLERARAAGTVDGKIQYQEGAAEDIPLPDEMADIVIFIHVLVHLSPDLVMPALREAKRLLKDGGRILVKDNDFASWSITQGPSDPLTAPVNTLLEAWSDATYLCRQLPSLLKDAGFIPARLEIFHVLDDDEDSYGFKYVLLRSIHLHLRAGRCSQAMADALVQEAHARVNSKKFQALLMYGVCAAYLPARHHIDSMPRPCSPQKWTGEGYR
eukprot:TRINITY_DN122833_c0_g1_i1.p1 TRINITY_DN122833_c0_g1~~TRINITY_DN122833_c0_g1_i1.p1  ORF type:complete len:309 (+),score=71.71 TRINITY_DN122833_c0_g1_i1:196-1122(+)